LIVFLFNSRGKKLIRPNRTTPDQFQLGRPTSHDFFVELPRDASNQHPAAVNKDRKIRTMSSEASIPSEQIREIRVIAVKSALGLAGTANVPIPMSVWLDDA